MSAPSPTSQTAIAYLLLGTNLGDRNQNLKQALNLLNKRAGIILQQSAVYETQPWGYTDDQLYLNQVIKVTTWLQPVELLQTCLAIEAELGRERLQQGYAARVLDVDILFYNDLIVEDDKQRLHIPHPRLHVRRFTLVPLHELAPELRHPVLNQSIAQLLIDCPDPLEVIKQLP